MFPNEKNTFRPGLEALEDRTLLTCGLNGHLKAAVASVKHHLTTTPGQQPTVQPHHKIKIDHGTALNHGHKHHKHRTHKPPVAGCQHAHHTHHTPKPGAHHTHPKK